MEQLKPPVDSAQSFVKDPLTHFGFSFRRGGAHLARTMMLEELEALLSYVDRPDASLADYRQAICKDNCLRKRSGKTRILTYRHLVDLYALDPNYALFRALLYFWSRDPDGRPLLAFLAAYSRDSILRLTAPFFLKISQGVPMSREALEEFIDAQAPGRFSQATLKSTIRNISSTWTKSGHLSGRSQKVRSQATPTPGAVSFALFLGYLTGARGEALFHTDYAKLLDCSFEVAVELASSASQRGWIVQKRVGKVIEVLFPNLLTQEEVELTREQN